jgi:UDP-glucose 4-epimerase
MKYALITGSAGLIGSQSVDFFIEKGYNIIGVDNDMRSYFFGEEASTKKSMEKLISKHKNYQHYSIDIINKIAGTNWSNYTISEDNRIGDHIWYISDLSKFKKDYPKWEITHSIINIIKQMVKHEYNKQPQL